MLTDHFLIVLCKQSHKLLIKIFSCPQLFVMHIGALAYLMDFLFHSTVSSLKDSGRLSTKGAVFPLW